MKVAYFDCFAGASGDMITGALIDAGLPVGHLKIELKKLGLKGYTIESAKAEKKGIAGTAFHVHVSSGPHHDRHLEDIRSLFSGSGLSEKTIEKCIRIFTRLAEAEAKIHNTSVEKIHFHEVGALDSIIDVAGAVIGLEHLGIEECQASRMHEGTGSLECTHGILPVPPPATLELLKNIPVYSTGIESEMVTPTGAAILSTLALRFDGLPSMTVERTGYGLGTRDLPIPNLIRVIIGEKAGEREEDAVQLVETNIDDMNPQFYEHIMESLFAGGARDVFLTPIIMKKNRPGVVLSVLASPEHIHALIDVLFRETTTLGVRISEVRKRMILKREIVSVDSPWGAVRVKIRTVSGMGRTAAPEYDDCKRLAQENKIPLHRIYEEVRKIAEEKWGSGSLP